MYFLNGFVMGFLLGATVFIFGREPERPDDHYNRMTCETGFCLGVMLGFGFLVACILWLCLGTGVGQ